MRPVQRKDGMYQLCNEERDSTIMKRFFQEWDCNMERKAQDAISGCNLKEHVPNMSQSTGW